MLSSGKSRDAEDDECGEEIAIPRLKARPVTRLCINCKAKQEEDEHLRGD